MVKTKEEQNAARRKRRYANKRAVAYRCIEQLENIYKNARRFYYERSFINNARAEVLNDPDFRKLPETWREFVNGADHVFTRDFEKELEWVHIHPKTGQRVPRCDPSLEGQYHAIVAENSCFCYVLSDSTFLPIEEKYRTNEDRAKLKQRNAPQGNKHEAKNDQEDQSGTH